jgi:hypothetical protein
MNTSSVSRVCTACGGDGWLPSRPPGQSTCPYCQGQGRITTTLKERFAYTAVLRDDAAEDDAFPWGLAIAEADEPGYRPYRGAVFSTFRDAQTVADEMNARLGLTALDATQIVLSSMRTGVPRRRA